MAEGVSLELIGKTVLETRDAVRKLAGVPEATRHTALTKSARPGAATGSW
jgi:hypothetical protein